MTRNRESVILSASAAATQNIATALAVLPINQHPQVHAQLNECLHRLLIVAEEIRQEWKEGTV